MKNRINKIEKQPNKNMLNKAKHKTRRKCMKNKRKKDEGIRSIYYQEVW